MTDLLCLYVWPEGRPGMGGHPVGLACATEHRYRYRFSAARWLAFRGSRTRVFSAGRGSIHRVVDTNERALWAKRFAC